MYFEEDGKKLCAVAWCFWAETMCLGRSDRGNHILNLNENIRVQYVFCDRISHIEDFYKLEINFVFQNLCYLFHYLINKILGFGVDFSALLSSLEKLETFKHASWYDGGVVVARLLLIWVLIFFWRRLWHWLNMEFQRHVAAWKVQCTF